MARFDVPVPETQDPSYLHLSKPIGEPAADRSKAIAISGIGSALEQGVKDTDKAISEHAQFLGEQEGEAEQSDFLSKVSKIDNLLQNKDTVPGQVSNALNFIARNQDAYDQGKLRETEYLRNLYEKSKAFRSGPLRGYSDYYDKGVEKITGITPNANALIKSILSDINDRKSKDDKYKYEIFGKAQSLNADGFPGMDAVANGVMNGSMSLEDANKKINQASKIKYDHLVTQGRIADLTLGKDIDAANQTRAVQSIAPFVAEHYQQTLDGLTVNLGNGPEKVMDILEQASAGKRPNLTDDQFRAIAMYENQQFLKMKAYADKEMSKPASNGGPSIMQAAGEKYADAFKKASTMHEMFQQAMTEKDTGWVNRMHNYITDQISGAGYKTLQNKDYSSIMLLGGTLHRIGGDALVGKVLSVEALNQGLLKSDTNSLSSLMTILGTKSNFAGVSSLSDAMDTVIKDSGDGAGNPNPAALDTLLKTTATGITDKDVPDQVKLNLASMSFGPKNDGSLQKIELPAKFDMNNIFRPTGRYKAFEYFGAADTAKEMKRLSDTYGPSVYEQYSNWMTTTFARDLFSHDLDALSNIQKQPNFHVKMVESEGAAPKFVIEQQYRGGLKTGGTTPQPPASPEIQGMLYRVNRAMGSLYNVYQAGGEDKSAIKARLLEIFQAKGINPNTGNSVARDMLLGIGSTKKPEVKKDEGRAPSGSGNE